jgi:hypothetical protein
MERSVGLSGASRASLEGASVRAVVSPVIQWLHRIGDLYVDSDP